MISFKQFLEEVFDKSFPYTKKVYKNAKDETIKTVYKFKNKNHSYDVVVAKYKPPFSKNSNVIYDISLEYIDKSNSRIDGFELTSINDKQFKILSTTRKILIDYFIGGDAILNSGDVISFESYNDKTIKLYGKFASELAKLTNTTLRTSKEGKFNLVK